MREVSALLYLPGQPASARARAARSRRSARGWRHSFRALLEQLEDGGARQPRPRAAERRPPAWTGFRAVPDRRVDRETPLDRLVRASSRSTACRLPAAAAPASSSPSACDRPGAPRAAAQLLALGRRRTRAATGSASSASRVGAVQRLPARRACAPATCSRSAAPRGDLHARRGARGRSPSSAPASARRPCSPCSHALAAAGDEREVWWVHGARNGAEHAFADEARRHLAALPSARSHVRFSRPRGDGPAGPGLRRAGRVTSEVVEDLGVPPAADCVPLRPDGVDARLSAPRSLAAGVAPERAAHRGLRRRAARRGASSAAAAPPAGG